MLGRGAVPWVVTPIHEDPMQVAKWFVFSSAIHVLRNLERACGIRRGQLWEARRRAEAIRERRILWQWIKAAPTAAAEVE
jgi:hypothetical protein